ncbi:hypothetical protein SNEBB_010890 [Seison nebaliae]|nr:hypothetical protein SNEBB_010890 [Seison nebaliae]
MASTDPLDKVYPLASSKQNTKICELCRKPAYLRCSKCKVAYYCCEDHRLADWSSIHQYTCDDLKILRTPMTFLPSSEQRAERDQQLMLKRESIRNIALSVGRKYLFQNEYEKAIPAALQVIVYEKTEKDVAQLIPAYLILAEASQGLGNLEQAQTYMAQAEWAVLKLKNCPLEIRYQFHRNMAMLEAAKGHISEALRHLATDIYYATEKFGLSNIHVISGYFLMANIFYKQEYYRKAMPLYEQVSVIWYDYLRERVLRKMLIIRENIKMGKKEEILHPSVTLDLSLNAEVRKIIQSLYDLRMIDNDEQFQENIDNPKLSRTPFLDFGISALTLAMIYYLSVELDECKKYCLIARKYLMKSLEFRNIKYEDNQDHIIGREVPEKLNEEEILERYAMKVNEETLGDTLSYKTIIGRGENCMELSYSMLYYMEYYKF